MTVSDASSNLTAAIQSVADATAEAADPRLVEMFRELIIKAREVRLTDQQDAQTKTMVMNFDGAGTILRVGMAGAPSIPPGGLRVIACHITAGIWSLQTLSVAPVNVTATVDIRLSQFGTWAGGSIPITGASPISLVGQSEAEIDTTLWDIVDMQPGDVMSYALTTFAGTATFLTVTLTFRNLNVTGSGVTPVTTATTDTLVDNDGNPVVVR